MKTKSNMTDNREIKCKFCKGTGKIYSSKMTTPSGLIDCPDCKTKSNMTVSKLQSEAVLEFDDNVGTALMTILSLLKANIQLDDIYDSKKCPIIIKDIKQFLSDQIQKAYEIGLNEMLNIIGEDQGWEESRDIYADALGLPLKYPQLMKRYKKRNHIKGKIVLDFQKLSIQSKEK